MARTRTRIIAAAAAVAAAALVATALAVANPAQAAGGVSATFSKDSDWGTGYQGKYTITNGSSSTVSSWTVTFTLASGLTMGTYWDALITTSGQTVTANNRDYNATIAPGASVTFGFCCAVLGLALAGPRYAPAITLGGTFLVLTAPRRQS